MNYFLEREKLNMLFKNRTCAHIYQPPTLLRFVKIKYANKNTNSLCALRLPQCSVTTFVRVSSSTPAADVEEFNISCNSAVVDLRHKIRFFFIEFY